MRSRASKPAHVQVQIAPGLPRFNVVGLPDKAVSEARERVRAALVASGLALPARRITVNLAPADLPKEGYRNLADSKAYRVPLLPSVPLNSKAYFPRCPTDFSGLRRSWESNRGRGRESNHGHRRWLVATPRHSKDETQLAGPRAGGFLLTRQEAAWKMGCSDLLADPHVIEAQSSGA